MSEVGKTIVVAKIRGLCAQQHAAARCPMDRVVRSSPGRCAPPPTIRAAIATLADQLQKLVGGLSPHGGRAFVEIEHGVDDGAVACHLIDDNILNA